MYASFTNHGDTTKQHNATGYIKKSVYVSMNHPSETSRVSYWTKHFTPVPCCSTVAEENNFVRHGSDTGNVLFETQSLNNICQCDSHC